MGTEKTEFDIIVYLVQSGFTPGDWWPRPEPEYAAILVTLAAMGWPAVPPSWLLYARNPGAPRISLCAPRRYLSQGSARCADDGRGLTTLVCSPSVGAPPRVPHYA